MPDYCGTNDCINIYEDFSSLVSGSTAEGLITEASRKVTADFNNFRRSPIPLSGGTYSYYVTRAAALQTVYMSLYRRFGETLDVGEDGWWERYNLQYEDIIERARQGKITLEADVSPWERGIGPIEEAVNGTVSAPSDGMAESNAAIEGEYYNGHDMPRVFIVQLDGAGSTIAGQTFKWKYEYGSKWEDETIDCDWDWTYLSYGVAVRFIDSGTFENGQQWEIPCNPVNYDRQKFHSTITGYRIKG